MEPSRRELLAGGRYPTKEALRNSVLDPGVLPTAGPLIARHAEACSGIGCVASSDRVCRPHVHATATPDRTPMPRAEMNTRSRLPVLASLIAPLIFSSATASAQGVFVPVDFGAAYEPEQLNKSLVKTATEDGRFDMMSLEDRDKLLEVRFPELTLPNVADLEQKFADGRDAYFNGDYDPASKLLNEALDEASSRQLALSLRPGFAETTWQGGLYLVQIYYFV